MTLKEAKQTTQSKIQSEEDKLRIEQDELTEKYYSIAQAFIRDASERGSFNTAVCYQYDEEFRYDRKHQEQYEWALQRAAFRLRQEGFTSRFYHNRAIRTMGFQISWENR